MQCGTSQDNYAMIAVGWSDGVPHTALGGGGEGGQEIINQRGFQGELMPKLLS